MSHIYKVTDTRNGKCYIGQHIGTNRYYFASGIILDSIIDAAGGMGHARHFLKREIIIQGNFNAELLDELERHYIRLHNTKKPFGYNLTDGGRGTGGIDPDIAKLRGERFRGYKHTDRSKAKMSAVHSGKKLNDSQIAVCVSNGRKHLNTPSAIAKRVEVRRARGSFNFSEKHKENMRKSSARRGRVATNARAVLIFKDDVLIAEYETILSAAQMFFKHKHNTTLLRALNGRGILRGYVVKFKPT